MLLMGLQMDTVFLEGNLMVCNKVIHLRFNQWGQLLCFQESWRYPLHQLPIPLCTEAGPLVMSFVLPEQGKQTVPGLGTTAAFLFVAYFVPWNFGMTFKWKRFFGTHEGICALSHTSETKMAPRVPPPHIRPPPATHFFYPLWLWSIPQQLLHHTSYKK